MIEIKGDIWNWHLLGYPICITTNGTLKKNGEGVMGAGVAKEAKGLWPDLPRALGQHLRDEGNHMTYFPKENIFLFPVKHEWYQPADLKLIERSCLELSNFMNSPQFKLPTVILPRPGCGNGKLNWETQVKPVIAPLLGAGVYVITNE